MSAGRRSAEEDADGQDVAPPGQAAEAANSGSRGPEDPPAGRRSPRTMIRANGQIGSVSSGELADVLVRDGRRSRETGWIGCRDARSLMAICRRGRPGAGS